MPSDRKAGLLLLLGLVLAGLLVLKLAYGVADPDVWGYLSFGREFWRHGFPFQDPFSYAPVLPRWIYHEWLTGVLFYRIYAWWGGAGLVAVKYLGLAGAGWFLYRTARLGAANRELCAACLLPYIMAASMFATTTRAQVLTVFFFGLTLLVLESVRRGGRIGLLWWLIPVNIVWANCHGGFLVGLVLAGLYGCFWPLSGKARWQASALLLGAGLATLINPYGWGYWAYLVMAMGKPRPFIPEWASVATAFRTGQYRDVAVFTCLLTAFLLGGLAAARRRNWLDAMLLFAFAAAAVGHIRHGIFLACLAGVCLPRQFEPAVAALGRRLGPKLSGIFRGLTMGVCVLVLVTIGMRLLRRPPAGLVVPDSVQAGTEGLRPYYPVQALAALARIRTRANILCHFPWGEYSSWEYAPGFLVGMDGRYETVYPEFYEKEYFDFFYGRPGWQRAVEAYPVDAVLVPPDVPAADKMRQFPGWRLAYQDAGSLLFVKELPATR